MKLWRKFNSFLNMTPREGAEMRDLAVFIRSLSLLFLGYFVLTSIALFATTYYAIAVIECLCNVISPQQGEKTDTDWEIDRLVDGLLELFG